MEFTQEQVNQMIADEVKKAKEGLFTEDELTKRVTSEVDRRVESGIQKGLETQRSKWEEEFTKKQNMTAEELAKQKLAEEMKNLSAKEKEINRKSNEINAKDMLSGAEIPKTQYEKILGMLVSDDEEITKTNVSNFVDMFNNTKVEIETKVKTELSKVTPPAGGSNEPVTKDIFKTMGYAEKVKFKAEYPDLYKEFMS